MRRGVYLLPSLFTLGNMFCGYACIVYSMGGRLELAAPFIGVAVVLDMLDGRIARMTGTATAFGVEFDSMADVISFGIAPAVLTFMWGLQPLQRLLRQDLIWTPSEVPGTEVAEVWHQEINWPQPRRVILLRHRVAEKERPGGKKLVDCPGYLYQALVTNLAESVRPIAVWREYNGRAGCEEVIKQLDADFGLPQLCLEKFWSTEAALSLAVLSYNLCVLFQRRLGWLDRVTAATLRFRLFTTGGIISQTAGRTTIRLSVPESERGWWREVLTKLRCEFPNCNAVSQTPG